MNAAYIKTLLLTICGESLTSSIHALRFVWLLRNGAGEDPEMGFLSGILKEGDNAVDVGANSANWTYSLYKRVGESGRVFAFEADPYYAKATLKAIRLLRMKSVVFFSFGLSDKEETVQLRITDESGLRHSGCGYVDKRSAEANITSQTIKLKPLDSLLSEHPGLAQARVVKIDVEGYELFVLKGASKMIDSARPIIVFEMGNYAAQGYSPTDISDFFSSRNYAIFAWTSAGELCRVLRDLKCGNQASVNRVAIPVEKLPEIPNLKGS